MINRIKMSFVLPVLFASVIFAYTQTVIPFDASVLNHGFPEIAAAQTEYIRVASLQDIPMNFMSTTDYSKPSNFTSLFLRGQYNGWFDYIEVGKGTVFSTVVSEDFENGVTNSPLSCSGWYAINGTSISNFVVSAASIAEYGRSGKVITGAMQAKKDFENTITDSTPNLYARFIVTLGNQNMKFGFYSAIRPGFYLDITPGGDIKLQSANFGTLYTSSGQYSITNYHTYEFVVQMTNINNGNKGWVSVRDITAAQTAFTALTSLQNVSMNFLNTVDFSKPSNFVSMLARGQYNGYFDHIELCEGIMPQSVVTVDFEQGTSGTSLSTDGWYAINSTNINNLIFGDSQIEEYGQSAKVITGYIQAKKDFTNTIVDSDPDMYAKFVVTFNNQNMQFGIWSAVRPGFYLNITPGGNIILQPANYASAVTSSGEYAILRNHTYEFIVKITNISTGGRGFVYARDITPGGSIETPITYKSYFKTERAMFDYYPRFVPGYVSFDESGKSFMQYGSSVIEQLDEDRLWQYDDVIDVIENYLITTLGYSTFEMRNDGAANEAAIRFDNDGDAYMLCHFLATRSNGTSAYVGVLLHSGDNMQTWTPYLLPSPFARFEKRDGHNADCLSRPPVLMLSSGYSPCTNYITIPQKQTNGTLVIPTPVLIDTNCISFAYHSGDGNSAVTSGSKVYITYGKLVTLPGHTQSEGVPAYAVEYDIATRQLSAPVLVGFGGINSEDNHNFPAITIDGTGILHIVISGHHDPFRYTYSTQPYNISAWSQAAEVSDGTSYCSINCDSNNTLYVITRCSNPGYYFRLTMHRKKAGQNWESDEHLLIPFKPYYKVWRHKVAYDAALDRLFLTYYSQSSQICVFKDEYLSYINTWPHTEKEFNVETGGAIPVGTAVNPTHQYEFYNPTGTEMCSICL